MTRPHRTIVPLSYALLLGACISADPSRSDSTTDPSESHSEVSEATVASPTITSPMAGTTITTSTFTLGGTCTPGTVVAFVTDVPGHVQGPCTNGAFALSLDVSSVPNGHQAIKVSSKLVSTTGVDSGAVSAIYNKEVSASGDGGTTGADGGIAHTDAGTTPTDGGLSTGSGATLVFNYPTGFASAGSAIARIGSVVLSGSEFELTTTANHHSAGGVWYATQQNITSFTTDFSFSIENSSAIGMAFVVQNSTSETEDGKYFNNWGTGAVADANGMGYGAYAPPTNPLGTAIYNSIAIAFDPQGQQGQIYPNNVATVSPGDSTSLTALYLEGAPWNPMIPEQDLLPFGVNLSSGHTMSAHVVYDGTLLTMVLKDTTTLAQARLQWPVDIPVMMAGSGIPPKGTGSSDVAWVGFTGSTVQGSDQNLYTWDFYEGYNTRLATPTFSLASGQYPSTQTVTISGPAGASIYYTTNGRLPTSASTLYNGPISVSANAVIQAVAIEPSYTDSLIGAATYQINNKNIINFPSGFAANDGVVLSGSAVLSGSQIGLTPPGNQQGAEYNQYGAAWYGVPVSVNGPWSTSFQLKFTSADGAPLGNGVTFCLQNQSQGNTYVANSVISGGPGALGADGAGLGYGGIMSSVALAFDLYSDPNSVGLYTNGATPVGSQTATGLSFGSGDVFDVSVSYSGTKLSMTMTDTVTKSSFTKTWEINIPATVGGNTAYVGFTGSTVWTVANQDILSWTYTITN